MIGSRVIDAPRGGGKDFPKTCVTMRGVFPSAEERARVIRKYGADKGLVQTLARLDGYVAGLNV